MVDISMEILASSVPIRNGYMPRYRVKTWWAHIDVPPDVTFIKLPRLPMIQPFLIMTGKDTAVFVETWQDQQSAIVGGGGGDGGIPFNKTRFLGITTCSVDEQLKTPNLNPSVQWLDVHDPIEDMSRGKLLVKIDAKFVLPEGANSPSRSENRHSLHGAFSQESPVKMIQSPRRSLAPNFPYEYNSPSSAQHVSSRTSLFSIRSGSSTRSQEQGVQTDLSLPIIPDISKYTAAFNPRSSFAAGGFAGEDKKSVARQNSRSTSEEMSSSSTATRTTAVPVIPAFIDPLKFAEEILKRNLSANDNTSNKNDICKTQTQRRTSEPAAQKQQDQYGTFRRSCLVRQHVQQQHRNDRVDSERTPSRTYDMESLEDVIDMLNKEGIQNDEVFSSQNPGSSLCNTASKRPPVSRSCTRPVTTTKPNSVPAKITGITKLPYSEGPGSTYSTGALKRESISSTASSLSQFQRQESFSPVSGATDMVRNDGMVSPCHLQGRFKEIHFDGVQAKKQQATSILMTRTTAQATATTQQPVVTRRRIAAAIFND